MKYTKNHVQYIRDNYLTKTAKEMAEHLKGSESGVKGVMKRNNIIIPKDIAEQRKKNSYFKKGHEPFNKGIPMIEYMDSEALKRIKTSQFKKGHEPHNTKYNGYERITKDGYIEVRIKKGVFRLKHIVEWEKINGDLKKGYCLWCLDGNIKNTNPSNWELITRQENIHRNVHSLPDELNRAKRLLTRLNKEL